MSNTAFAAVSVLTSATLIVAGSTRKGVLIANEAARTVFVGPTDAVTTGNGMPIPEGSTLIMTGLEAWKGPIYGIAAATSDIRYWSYGQ